MNPCKCPWCLGLGDSVDMVEDRPGYPGTFYHLKCYMEACYLRPAPCASGHTQGVNDGQG